MILQLLPSRQVRAFQRATWHGWFAWHPVRVSRRGEFRWLEWVERRVIRLGGGEFTYYRRGRS